MGNVVRRFSTLPSTNEYALTLLTKSEPIEGTVILADYQSAGRGQIGSKWESEPGKNLTLSFIFYPRFLPPRHQFAFNQAIALAVTDFLTKYFENNVKIKWPNDIYAGSRKIAGILIQNLLAGPRIRGSVAGIGLNVNQIDFPPHLPNPTSLALEAGRSFELPALLPSLYRAMEARYLQLKGGAKQAIQEEYRRRLYRLEEEVRFERPEGADFSGVILGVDAAGKLLVESERGTREAFDLKEIIYR